MVHGFDTADEPAGTAALLLYAAWRSRDPRRLKITPDIWSQVERFTKSAAKRATTLADFLERLMPRLGCDSLAPRWLSTDLGPLESAAVDPQTGEIVMLTGDRREFLTRVFSETDPHPVLDCLYRQTVLIVLLVRDRLEREKPYEHLALGVGDAES